MEATEVVVNPSALVIGWVVSIALVIAFVAAMLRRREDTRRGPHAKPIFLVTAVIVVLTFILTLSQGFALLTVPVGFASAMRCLLDSIHDTFQVISLDGSMRISPDSLQPLGWSPFFLWIYLIHQSALFVLAPATTLGSVAYALYSLLSSPALWWLSRTRDTYVFSEVNGSALTLAKSIVDHYAKVAESEQVAEGGEQGAEGGKGGGSAAKRRKAFSNRPVIAFAEVDRADEALVDEAHDLRFVCSERSIDDLAARCSKNKARCFVFSSENEAQNLRASLRLTETLMAEQRSRQDKRTPAAKRESDDVPTVIVFSTSSVSDGYVDAAVRDVTVTDDKGKASVLVRFRRFDHTQNTINQVLMERPVFLNASLAKANEADARRLLYTAGERRVLVVGAGAMGMAFLKGAIWSSQSNSILTHIDVVESNPLRKGRLALECPEVERMLVRHSTDDEKASAGTDGTAELRDPRDEAYDVEFHTFDVFSSEFDELMRTRGQEVSYVFVALGDDLASAQAARRIREMLERSRMSAGLGAASRPPIVVVIDDSLLAASIADATSSKGQSYEITPVGTQEALFSYKNVFQPELDRLASNLNAAYWGCYDIEDPAKRAGTRAGADASYERLEYNRISSKASAIFLKHHLFELCRDIATGAVTLGTDTPGLPSALDWTKPLDSPEFKAVRDAYASFVSSLERREQLQRLEHRRWNAFMRTLGYERCDEPTLENINRDGLGRNCDHLARLHICLAPFDELGDIDTMYYHVIRHASMRRPRSVTKREKRLVTRGASRRTARLLAKRVKKPDYKRLDDVIITHLVDIVEDGKAAAKDGEKS